MLRNDGVDADGQLVLTNVAVAMGLAAPRSSMGGVLGDYDDDGQIDIYVPNWGAKRVFVGDGTGGFTERAAALGLEGLVRRNDWCTGPLDAKCLLLTWSAVLVDIDLDGIDEVLAVNGDTVAGLHPPVLAFQRSARASAFTEVSPNLDCIDGRGMVATDLDLDGDADLVIAPHDGPIQVYETRGTPASTASLTVRLHGRVSNRQGIGAIVRVRTAHGGTRVQVVGAGGVINTSFPAPAFFGLGDDAVMAVEVAWPSGLHTMLAGPRSGTVDIDE